MDGAAGKRPPCEGRRLHRQLGHHHPRRRLRQADLQGAGEVLRLSATRRPLLSVMPAKAGIQGKRRNLMALDSRFRGNDGGGAAPYPPGPPLVVEYSKCSASPGWTSGWMAWAAMAASEKPQRINFSLPG